MVAAAGGYRPGVYAGAMEALPQAVVAHPIQIRVQELAAESLAGIHPGVEAPVGAQIAKAVSVRVGIGRTAGGIGPVLCRELRRTSRTPVIFASARTCENDRVTGFDIGGDDYLPKPYSMKELLSRVNALIRRAYGFSECERVVEFGEISVNITARTVTKSGLPLSLSLREFDLLAYLCEHKNTAVAKEKLLSEVWGAFCEVEPSTLAVHIRWLREKLEKDPSNPRFIKTVYKVGYMLEIPDCPESTKKSEVSG